MKRRGSGEALMFFTFFVIITLIGAGVFWNVLAFYGRSYDFRSVHAELLAEKVDGCLEKMDPFASDFNLGACSIYVPADADADYMIYINASDGREAVFGVRAYMMQCELAESNPEYARCVRGVVIREGMPVSYTIGLNREVHRQL
jgi:hypothetical protein